jgi:hypothetical protein
MYWEICCRPTETGFLCEVPAGEYYIGDPEVMLKTGVAATIKNLETGTFTDAESDAIIVVHPVSTEYFRLSIYGSPDVNIFIEGPVIALMSADIVKPLPEFDEYKFTFVGRAVVEVHVNDDSIRMQKGTQYFMVDAMPEPDYEETDEQMYTRLYAAQGIQY